MISPLRIYSRAALIRGWDVAHNGRFLVPRSVPGTEHEFLDAFAVDRIHIILNLHEELKRKMAEAQ